MKKLYLSDVEKPLTMVQKLTDWNYKDNGDNTAIGYIKGIPVIFKWDLREMHINCASEDLLTLKAIIKGYCNNVNNEHPNIIATYLSYILQYTIEFWKI